MSNNSGAVVEGLEFGGVFVFEVRVAVVTVISEAFFPAIKPVVAGLLLKECLCGE